MLWCHVCDERPDKESHSSNTLLESFDLPRRRHYRVLLRGLPGGLELEALERKQEVALGEGSEPESVEPYLNRAQT